MEFKEYLLKVSKGENLTKNEAYQAINEIFNGEISDIEIGGLLLALRTKGESYEEIAGMAQGMIENAMALDTKRGLFDNCGTGGDRSFSFNISTTNSFVLAAGGVKMAKHGNRSISSKSGSADLLESLGVNLNLSKDAIENLMDEIGIVFLFAPNVHPKLAQIMKVRRTLKIPTIFNILGPLANPYKIDKQLLGIYSKDLVEPMARAMQALGRTGIVVNGNNHLDEGTLTGDTYMAIVDEDNIELQTITPESVGLNRISLKDIEGGDPEINKKITLDILNGKEHGPKRDIILFNAALGFLANKTVKTIEEGINLAREVIDQGKALDKLIALVEGSKKYA